ncbi:RIP metalloprotease [Micromonospora sp. CV4]|uniref:M50 family metallopeptidase n=1 Tax=Micromonospora sp. CV4 TaxID=2478711 RepID=UPI000EF51489|nr:M50 family metallopeptidase [Micromonospora sp. CV4]RLP95917.1 RIP metalloprotease [Micromonospora sp. CV4]
MTYVLGVVLFAIGILISVALHEAGHMGTARMFGMKVTRFFIGFGPTLWSFRRRETEYGVKAIPAGAFVKIVGMTQQDDDVDPADDARAMWRYPVWKRTIVMSAGSMTHFALGALILWGLFAFVPLQDAAKLQSEPVRVGSIAPCVQATWSVDPATKRERECRPGADPPSAAAQLGLRRGDVITAIDGRPLHGWDTMSAAVRAAGGRQVEVAFVRDGQSRMAVVTLPLAERVRLDVVRDPTRTIEDITPADLEEVGVLGITPIVPTSTAGPVAAVGRAADQTGLMFSNTLHSLQRVPEKIPALWAAVTGGERDPETPISVVGASRIGGELSDRGEWPTFLLLLAALNFFIGVFNLLPLLPVDGGHIAIAWFERARSLLYARLGRPDPGRVDYLKLMPLTYAVILIFAGFTLLTLVADIINPITLPD